jgi:hypothetical protein
MDRDTAFKLLGLYVGASPEHIQLKYQSASEVLQSQIDSEPARRPEFEAQLRQLGHAREVALGRGEDSGLPQHTPAWRRGPVVLLMLALALVVCVGGFFVAARWLDHKQAAREAADKRELVLTSLAAWDDYRAKTGLAQTPDGERAEAALQDAQQLEDQGDYARAGEGYGTALDLFQSAFAAENARLNAHWQQEVREPWQRLKACFPFDEASEVEADPALVAALFNPVSGAVWSRQREFDALAATDLAGLSAAALPQGYAQALEHAGRIRDALFGPDSEQVNVMFSIKLVEETKSLAELVLETGGASISHRAPNFTSASWTPKTAGARLRLKKLGERTPSTTPIDFGESSWGMLQLLRHCDYSGLQEGDHVWGVEFDGLADRRGKTRAMTGSIRIRLDRAANPFDFATYQGFKP